MIAILVQTIAFLRKNWSRDNCNFYSDGDFKQLIQIWPLRLLFNRDFYQAGESKAYFLVYFNFSTRTKIYINDFLLYHELFINKVGSSWQLQQAPNHEKVAFLQGSPLNSPFLVEFLEPFQSKMSLIKNVDFVEVKTKNK